MQLRFFLVIGALAALLTPLVSADHTAALPALPARIDLHGAGPAPGDTILQHCWGDAKTSNCEHVSSGPFGPWDIRVSSCAKPREQQECSRFTGKLYVTLSEPGGIPDQFEYDFIDGAPISLSHDGDDRAASYSQLRAYARPLEQQPVAGHTIVEFVDPVTPIDGVWHVWYIVPR